MKNLIILIFFLFAYSAFAANAVASTEVDVLSAEFGVENEVQEKTLCLTTVRVPANGKLLGIVEDIHDCYYARIGKKNHTLKLAVKKLKKIDDPNLRDHLQRMDAQLEFYFSDEE